MIWIFWAAVALNWLTFRLVARAFSGQLWLSQFEGQEPRAYPRVSVVVAGCNEGPNVKGCLSSLLAGDYPDLEVVFVDDRSDDDTGAVAEALAAGDHRLKVIRNEHLPAGWLGKNHALWLGQKQATGSLLLFTDADVIFGPKTLRQAVNAMVNLNVHHLVVAPDVVRKGFWERLMVSYFLWIFMLRFQPTRVFGNNRFYVGVGAFNLVQAGAYRMVGGHASLPMEVADDVVLGKWLKYSGFRQGLLGGEEVRVRWVEGLSGMISGLEKNAYAGFGFSRLRFLREGGPMILAAVAPLLMLGSVPGWAWLLYLLPGVLLSVAFARLDPQQSPFWLGFFYPLAGLVLSFILLRSAWLAERRGGIYWRGTFYELKALREASWI